MTTLELTVEQRTAVQANQNGPIDVVDPATSQRYVLLAREQYERLHSLLEGGLDPGLSPPAGSSAPSPLEVEPVRVHLRDLPTPAEVVEEAQRWCKKYGWWGKRKRREVEEQFKLQYYYGGQAVYLLDTAEGVVVIPITQRYKDTPGLRYVLLNPEERSHACLDVPSRWQETGSEILT